MIPSVLLGAAAAAGQPCTPIDCSQLSVADEPGFPLPEAGSLAPDRRPAIAVNLFGGSCLNPPTGGPDWWHDLGDADGNGAVDAVDELIGRLQALYEDGWRRIILNKPAGSLSGQPVSSSQWWPMPELKRRDLAIHLRMWIEAHPDVTVGIYAGYKVNDPCNLCMVTCIACVDCGEGGGCTMCPDCAGMPAPHPPLTTNHEDMCVVSNNVRPWIGSGISEIWFDASGGTESAIWVTTLSLAGNPDYDGIIRFAAEPIINFGPGDGTNIPYEPVLSMIPYVATRKYYRSVSRFAAPGAWDFDPLTTEVIVAFRDSDFCVDAVPGDGIECTDCPSWCGGQADTVLIDVVYDYVQRGYVPYSRWHRVSEFIRRIYDIAPETVPCAADLDADGDVDFLDAARLLANMGLFGSATLYDGDLDFDDDVDIFDYMILVGDPSFPSGPCPEAVD